MACWLIIRVGCRNCGGLFDIDGKEGQIIELEAATSAPDFWNDVENAQRVTGKISTLKSSVARYMALQNQLEDSCVLWDLAVESDDEQLAAEAKAGLSPFQKALEALELAVLLSGPYDDHDAIMSLHAGAGGVEAQDWVEMLLRMYTRYCEREGYKIEMLDFLPGDEAGVKSVTFSVSGPSAYGYLKSERGVHRLVRISPFDAAGRRHTSFASMDVLPQVEDDTELKIDNEELRIDTYRSSGKGGQHLNKTDSAVRITHLPTGIVTQCQDERSQHANKDRAMRMLAARLLDIKAREREEELRKERGEQQEIGWGSQIRSYVFQPYRLVKDHRTGVEMGNVDAVMDGELEPFIAAYLRKFAAPI